MPRRELQTPALLSATAPSLSGDGEGPVPICHPSAQWWFRTRSASQPPVASAATQHSCYDLDTPCLLEDRGDHYSELVIVPHQHFSKIQTRCGLGEESPPGDHCSWACRVVAPRWRGSCCQPQSPSSLLCTQHFRNRAWLIELTPVLWSCHSASQPGFKEEYRHLKSFLYKVKDPYVPDHAGAHLLQSQSLSGDKKTPGLPWVWKWEIVLGRGTPCIDSAETNQQSIPVVSSWSCKRMEGQRGSSCFSLPCWCWIGHIPKARPLRPDDQTFPLL